MAAGAIDEARRAAERVVAVDPLAEPAYRLLARSLLADDDAMGARRTLAQCREALADLGVTPDDATRALEDQLAI